MSEQQPKESEPTTALSRAVYGVDDDEKVNALVRYLDGLGLDRLATEISDERFAQRIVEQQTLINSLAIEQAHTEGLQERLEQKALEMHSILFDKAATHNNIIASLGYAGFFAIWGFVKDELHPWDTKLVALLLGLSLLCFIYTILRSSWFSTMSTARIAAVYNNTYENLEKKVEALLEQEEQNQRQAMAIYAAWPKWYIFSTVTGFGAGAILLSVLLFHIFGVDFSVYESGVSLIEWGANLISK